MPDLPTGTVTFFFSDMEGSTRLLQSCGARWPELLARHGEVLREAFARHGGVEVGTEGDSFFAAFETAGEAVAAAVEIQQRLAVESWPGGETVRVRIGLHTGDATVSDGTYVGLDVHRAARIMAAGHGGQVLVSAATEALARGSLGNEVRLVDLGEHRLRDLPAAERLYQVVAPDLESSFPPLRGVTATPTNLPIELTSFVGREDETRAVLDRLAEHRVVTLTGPGGTGKTRLAMHVARVASPSFAGGVFFVPLAEIRDVELVLPTIGQVLGLVEPGRDPLGRIPEHVGGHAVLLVLDNLEQVLPAAADLAELVRRAPQLSMLVTSRAALRIYGEVEYPVPPLPMPDPDRVTDPGDIERYPAIALFVERARAVRPDFAVTADNGRAIVELCQRLDGLPLAIELAAARVRILSPQAIVARLERRLDLASSPSPDRPERQQTLRGAIAWSYELLDADDRRFFARFSVFRGGADLEAIETVVMAGGDPLDRVASLLDKSLLRQDETDDGSARFRMLETIREYAAERLAEESDGAEVERAAATYYLELVERLAPSVLGGAGRAARLIEREHDNVRAAIDWAVGHDRDMALRWLRACWRFWQVRAHLEEGYERAKRVLALDVTEADPRLLADAEEAAGGMAYWLGDMINARAHYGHALELQRRIGDDAAVANALYNLASSHAIDLERPHGPIDPGVAAAVDEARAIYRRLGDRGGEGRTLWASMNLHIFTRQVEEARRIGADVLSIFEEVDDQFMLAWTRYMLGANENVAGRPDASLPLLHDALAHFVSADDLSGLALTFDAIAASAFLSGDLTMAMRLAGAASAIQTSGGTQLGMLNRAWNDFYPERLLERPELRAEWEAGTRMEPMEAAGVALEYAAGRGVRGHTEPNPAGTGEPRAEAAGR